MAQGGKGRGRISLAPILVGIGSIMMLVSLAIPWYAVRLGGESANVSASDLITETDGISNWAGSALPVIIVIVLASTVLIGVIYSIVAGRAVKLLWSVSGSLSALAVIANALYILWGIHDDTGTYLGESQWVNIVHGGSVLAFVGALIIVFGSLTGKRIDNTISPKVA